MGRRSKKVVSYNRSLEILIDGRVLKHQAKTGVERYTEEIVRGLKENFDYPIRILTPPAHNRWIHHIWEHTVLPLKAYHSSVLFCPANISPVVLPKRTKLITTVHDTSFYKFPDGFSKTYRLYYSLLTPLTVKRSNEIITVSKFAKEELEERFPELKGKVHVIYSGVSEKFLTAPAQKRENFALFVGSLTERKNLKRLLQAFKLSLKETNCSLYILGPSPKSMVISEEISHLVVSIPQERIKLLGSVSDEELVKLYSKAKFFIFPSLYEAFGFPPLEAMACGCPVAASRTSAIPEICGNAAHYFDPLNVEEIAEAIIKLDKDENLRRELSKRGKERVKRFSWKRSIREHIKLLKSFS